MRCPDELVAAVDAARGDVPREVWLRRAVEEGLRRSAQQHRSDEIKAQLEREHEAEQHRHGWVRASEIPAPLGASMPDDPRPVRPSPMVWPMALVRPRSPRVGVRPIPKGKP